MKYEVEDDAIKHQARHPLLIPVLFTPYLRSLNSPIFVFEWYVDMFATLAYVVILQPLTIATKIMSEF